MDKLKVYDGISDSLTLHDDVEALKAYVRDAQQKRDNCVKVLALTKCGLWITDSIFYNELDDCYNTFKVNLDEILKYSILGEF